MKQIWCLFSIDNQYYQPDNNLEAWWVNKPSLEQLIEALDTKHANKSLQEVLDGKEVRIYGADYRLEEVSEGTVKSKA